MVDAASGAAAGSTLGPWGAIAGAGIGAVANIFGANAQADAARKQAEIEQQQIAFNQQQQTARQNAYNNMLTTSGNQMGAADTAFNNSVSQAPTELAQAKQDVLAGSARGINKAADTMGASNAANGIRGGQAATLLNRGIGEMGIQTQENLNQMGLTDAETRAAALRSYEAMKAGNAQQANLKPAQY
jgi:hypothetical protein